MKISQAIEVLNQIAQEHGDLEVATLDEVDDFFAFGFGKVFDVVEMPREESDENTAGFPPDTFEKVCAFVMPEDLQEPHLRSKYY